MKRVFAGNLPADTTERELTELFAAFGKVFSIKLVQDVFSGQCKGFGFVEMEGHEARAAIAAHSGPFSVPARCEPDVATCDR